jgi:hypothetical protein
MDPSPDEMLASARRRRRYVAVIGAVCALGAAAIGGTAWSGMRADGSAAASRAAADPLRPFAVDDTTIDDCTGGDVRCLEQAYGNIAHETGPSAAFATLRTASETNPQLGGSCHAIAHRIGAATLSRTGGDVGRAFVDGAGDCQGGYYHGLVQHAFQGASGAALDDRVRGVCSSEEVLASGDLTNHCLHGIGHGLMLHLRYDVRASLSKCDVLQEQAARSCHGGAFMEAFTPSYTSQSEWSGDREPLAHCAMLAVRYRGDCAYAAGGRLAFMAKGNWDLFAQHCRGDGDMPTRCFEALGSNASTHLAYSPRLVARACRKATARSAATACVTGAARAFASNRVEPEVIRSLCEAVGPDYADACYSGVGNIIATMHPTVGARRSACEAASPTRHVPSCRRGALS